VAIGPITVLNTAKAEAEQQAMALLAKVGLADKADNYPVNLSGGQQQRVAIARAVANRPRILLADEPTGNLDPATSDRVFITLLSLVKATGLAALIATHNLELARRMDRRVTIRDGLVVELD
jgi:lipoprotein-releasing system ATP-binding protein